MKASTKQAGTIVLLGLVLTWGLATPLRAQRFGNSTLDFYDQGLQQLEREIQRLQVEPDQNLAPLLTPPSPSPQPIESTAPSPLPTTQPQPSPDVTPEQPSS